MSHIRKLFSEEEDESLNLIPKKDLKHIEKRAKKQKPLVRRIRSND